MSNWTFKNRMTATLRAENSDGGVYNIAGVTTEDVSPDNAAEQVNKLLEIAGVNQKRVFASDKMQITFTKGAVFNG